MQRVGAEREKEKVRSSWCLELGDVMDVVNSVSSQWLPGIDDELVAVAVPVRTEAKRGGNRGKDTHMETIRNRRLGRRGQSSTTRLDSKLKRRAHGIAIEHEHGQGKGMRTCSMSPTLSLRCVQPGHQALELDPGEEQSSIIILDPLSTSPPMGRGRCDFLVVSLES